MKPYTWREAKWIAIWVGMMTFAGFCVFELGPVPGVILMLASTPVAHKMFPKY